MPQAPLRRPIGIGTGWFRWHHSRMDARPCSKNLLDQEVLFRLCREQPFCPTMQMPLLALWGANGAIAAHFDCLAMWRERADFVAGKPLQGGHYLAEEVPEAVLAEWVPFFAALV